MRLSIIKLRLVFQLGDFILLDKINTSSFVFALQSKCFLAIIDNAISTLGEYGEAVNTSGCEPDIGRCDSCYSPHLLLK